MGTNWRAVGAEEELAELRQRVNELTCQKTALQQVVSERDEEIQRLKDRAQTRVNGLKEQRDAADLRVEELRWGLEKIGNGQVTRGEAQALARTLIAKEGM